MKKISFLLITALLVLSIQPSWAAPFKFPKRIEFVLFKGGQFMGKCVFKYTPNIRKKANKRPLSLLSLIDFGGFGFTSKVKMYSYIFSDDFSAYHDSVFQGRSVIEEIKLDKGIGIDGKEGQLFIYKGKDTEGSINTDILTRHKVITFLSSFFIASYRVAEGKHKKAERFNLLIDKSTKIVEMKYGGQETVPFAGKYVKAETILLTNPNSNNVEVFRMRIYKDSDGYYYPVSIRYSEENSFEIRADDVQK